MKPDAEVLEEVVVTGMQKWTSAFSRELQQNLMQKA